MRWTNLFAIGILLAGCSDSTTSNVALNQTLANIWQLSEGDPIPDGTREADQFLVLQEDGTGTLYTRNAEVGVVGCRDLVFSVLSDEALLLSLIDSFDGSQDPITLVYERNDGQLTLEDAAGGLSVFVPVNEVEAGFECKTFSDVTELPHVTVRANQSTNLVHSGGFLYYINDNTAKIQKYNLTTQQLETELAQPSGSWELQAMEGGSFWIGSGYTFDLKTDTGATSDTVEVYTLIPPDLYLFETATTDGTKLWTHGRNVTMESYFFVTVDSAAEPDTLLDTYPFDTNLLGLTWDGSYLWAVGNAPAAGQAVMKIDPATVKAVATYALPGPYTYWFGIASDGTHLFLLGETREAPVETRIAQVTP